MIPLLLVRHGKTEWNLQKRLQGRRDIELSDTGRSELEALQISSDFSKYHCLTSPLKRAIETAILLGCPSPEIDDRLIEMDFGDWEGFQIKELRAKYGQEMILNEAKGVHMRPPGGESPYDVQQRVCTLLKELNRPTIAFTHKGVIRAMKSLAYAWDMKDKSPVTFQWNRAHLFMVDENGLPHASHVNIDMSRKN